MPASLEPRTVCPLPYNAEKRRVRERTDEPFDAETMAFLTWLLRRSGVDIRHYRRGTLARRVRSCLRSLRATSLDDARRRLEAQPDRIAATVSRLLIGVTSFFRDPDVFGHFERQVLPELAADGQRLRIWSVGCSDGAELYSVALVLARAGLLQRSWLRGADCRAEAIERARSGLIDPDHLHRIDPDLRESFFRREYAGWRASETLRRHIEWQQRDIFHPAEVYDSAWDLILCRNMAIYLEPQAATALWQRLTDALRPGGILIVGKAERPGLRLLRRGPCIYQKRSP